MDKNCGIKNFTSKCYCFPEAWSHHFPESQKNSKKWIKMQFLSEFHNLAKIANILIKNASISKNQLFWITAVAMDYLHTHGNKN